MPSLESIFRLLQEANDRLNEAAHEIRDLPLEPRKEHRSRIGKALVEIFDIQYHVFALRPELTPDFLEGPFEHPEGAWNVALRHAQAAEKCGNIDIAIAILEWIAQRAGSPDYERRAKSEIARLRNAL